MDYKIIHEDGYIIRMPILKVFEPDTPMEIKPIELSPETKKWMAMMSPNKKELDKWQADNMGITFEKMGTPTTSTTNH